MVAVEKLSESIWVWNFGIMRVKILSNQERRA